MRRASNAATKKFPPKKSTILWRATLSFAKNQITLLSLCRPKAELVSSWRKNSLSFRSARVALEKVTQPDGHGNTRNWERRNVLGVPGHQTRIAPKPTAWNSQRWDLIVSGGTPWPAERWPNRIAYSRRARPVRYYKSAMRGLEAALRVAALIRFPCSNAWPETCSKWANWDVIKFLMASDVDGRPEFGADAKRAADKYSN